MNENKAFYSTIGSDKTFSRDVAYDKRNIEAICDNILSLKLGAGGQWLDIGCGVGMLAKLCDRVGLKYVGLDLASKNIPQNRDWEFVESDFVEYETDRRFSLITLISTLHHFEDQEKVLEKAYGLLEPGGVIYIDNELTHPYSEVIRLYYRLRGQGHLLDTVEIKLGRTWPPKGEVIYHYDFFFMKRIFNVGLPDTKLKLLSFIYPSWRCYIRKAPN